ncbi:CYTH domain-containing protein [Candidatus Woesearchaeota archaeon]|nr:CYTH domain-containing protein [Candidatus Woesearchaeota archaeon]MBW3022012.1 CYTH domain-containing protein [Candidatus Woesearchaeota archaeon]
MYEVELRGLVDDFNNVKERIESFAKPLALGQREATFFFHNPEKDDFHIRLRIRKDECVLSFKEQADLEVRKEVETKVSNPEAVYDLLKLSGFKIKYIFARVTYKYIHDKFEIMLNRVLDWGDAVEVETMVEDDGKVDTIKHEIKEIIEGKLGLPLLSHDDMKKRIDEFTAKVDLDTIKVEDLVKYVEGRDLRFF